MSTPESSNDEKSRQILSEMWDTMSTDLGADDDGTNHRYPRSLEEIAKLESGVDTLRALGSTDPQIESDRKQYEDLLPNAKRRSFQGSWKLVILSVVACLVFALSTSAISSSPITADKAGAHLTGAIDAEQKLLEARKANIATAAGSEQKEHAEKLAKESEEMLAHLESISPEQHMKEFNDALPSGYRNLVRLILFLCIPALYFISARTPGYLTVRRQTILRKWRTASGFLGRMAGIVVGAFMAVPVTTTIVHWSDGSKTKSDDALELGLVKIAFLAVVVVVFVVTVVYVLPVLTVANFALNYGPDLLFKIKHSANKPVLSSVAN